MALDAAVVALALLVTAAPLPAAIVERFYTNGAYAWMNATLVPVTNAIPFAFGDLEVGLAIVFTLALWVFGLRRVRGRRPRTVLVLFAHTVGFAAAIVLAFELLWAVNYHRAPVEARVDYDSARVNAAGVSALSARIVGMLNDDVVAAHARAESESPAATRAELARDFAPLAARLGDAWPVAVTVPKTTVADRLYAMAGVGGQYDPFAFETLLAATFLPYEWPRALAHEWAHVAGFGDEGDANVIGTIACLRSRDPLIRYSAAFWTYGELPEADRARYPVVPAVTADIAASRARFARYYDPRLFALSWHVYDRYLRASGVRGGVVSYGNDIRLLVGTSFDADGLPLRSARFFGEYRGEPARVLAEDRPQGRGSEPKRFEPALFRTVRIRHVRIVGTEDDVRGSRFDQFAARAGEHRRVRRERHRRVEVEVRMRRHQGDVARAIGNAEVRDDEA